MPIHLLQNKEINKQRWDNVIKQSPNGLIYAWSIYLDHLCPGWCALVNDDYSLLMPLTIRKKMGIRYLCQPPFCQQLGVFGTAIITEKAIEEFVAKAQKHISFAEININYKNFFKYDNSLKQRKNYIINLNNDYQSIRSNYSKELLKKNLSRTENYNFIYSENNNLERAVNVFKELYSARIKNIRDADYNNFILLCQALYNTGNVILREVKTPDNQLQACSIFLKDKNRIYNIVPSTLPSGKALNANHFLIDRLIQEFAGNNILLDFEGSDIPGIEYFYKKFGAIDQPYYFLKWNQLPWWIRWLKK